MALKMEGLQMSQVGSITAEKAHSPSAFNGSLAQLQDMDMEVSIELGRTRLTLDQVLDLEEQSLLELDRMVGEPVEIRLNGKLFAQGEVITVGENFGVRLTQIRGQQEAQEG